LFNFDRAFFEDQTTAIISSSKRSLQDRQRDVYDSHRHRVFALAYYMIGNEVLAEEALSKTFVQAFQMTEEPDAKSVDAALMGELRERMAFDVAVIPAQASPQDSLSSRNVRRTDLEEAVGELPAVERLAFLLKDVEGYSTEAISEFMGIPRADLPGILLSARIRLRSVLASGASSAAGSQNDPESDQDASAGDSAAA
jgi:RNA polymerase sigma-70 factor (ECF subfamily)